MTQVFDTAASMRGASEASQTWREIAQPATERESQRHDDEGAAPLRIVENEEGIVLVQIRETVCGPMARRPTPNAR